MADIAAHEALPAPGAARKLFDRASASFRAASVVHDEARDRLLRRLEYVRLSPETIVDLGCADGRGARALAARYPDARVVAVDASRAMLKLAARTLRRQGNAAVLGGDAERLPLAGNAAQLMLANMVLPWCRAESFFAEGARVLSDGGLLLFATLGPDSLQQVRRAWAAVDDRIHVHGFFDMHDLGDLAVAAGLREPVLDVDRIELSYRDVGALVRDLRDCGGVNVAAGRRRTLTGPERWKRFERAVLAHKRDGRFAITVELIFGQAWGAGVQRRHAEAPGEIAVPASGIGRVSRSRGGAS
ncbi:methyltransferase domain-containing protein [Candidatus Rariloculus sp.]|uniref:methyltransferase domain-containing protein n=1 Tax=Candidatus Rariloculus sp. TaxID=3101265 RepID=UPI003D0AB253